MSLKRKITDAEILESIQNKSENDKTLEDLMFSDHELVQKSSRKKRTAVSFNNRGLPKVNPYAKKPDKNAKF